MFQFWSPIFNLPITIKSFFFLENKHQSNSRNSFEIVITTWKIYQNKWSTLNPNQHTNLNPNQHTIEKSNRKEKNLWQKEKRRKMIKVDTIVFKKQKAFYFFFVSILVPSFLIFCKQQIELLFVKSSTNMMPWCFFRDYNNYI
jgi:hypothetical protein